MDNNDNHKQPRFHVTFSLEHHSDGVTWDEVQALPGTHGAGDAIIVASIIGDAERAGPYYVAWISARGPKGQRMNARELFLVWSVLALELAHTEALDEAPRQLCKTVCEWIHADAQQIIN